MKFIKHLNLLILLIAAVLTTSCIEKDEEDPKPKLEIDGRHIYGEWQLQDVKVDGATYQISAEEKQESYIEFTNETSWTGGKYFYAYLIDYSTDGDWKLEGNIIYLHSVIEAEILKLTEDELIFDLYEPDHQKVFTYSFTKD